MAHICSDLGIVRPRAAFRLVNKDGVGELAQDLEAVATLIFFAAAAGARLVTSQFTSSSERLEACVGVPARFAFDAGAGERVVRVPVSALLAGDHT